MSGRLQVLLVHGMDENPSWWDPIIPSLEKMGLTCHAPTLPSLETEGPESWVQTLTREIPDSPVLLIGHSLGAAVCTQVAALRPVSGLILLACPVPIAGGLPQAPDGTGLSLSALSRIGLFLMRTPKVSQRVKTEAIHFVGENDPWVRAEYAAQWPFPVTVIPQATHQLNRSRPFLNDLTHYIAQASFARTLLDPAVRYAYLAKEGQYPAAVLDLDDLAPMPARLDIEITTRCQLTCPLCARTLYPRAAQAEDMSIHLFAKILDEASQVDEIILVGLGEPLLHPEINAFVRTAADRGKQIKIVTNGLLASPSALQELSDLGLTEITFSLDTTDPHLFSKLRRGASLAKVLHNFRQAPKGLSKSIFAALSRDNVGNLCGLIDLAVDQGLPAIAVSDTNFAENHEVSLHANECEESLAAAVQYADQRNVLLISPHFHDLGDPRRTFTQCRVREPSDLVSRSMKHRYCLAPWRIAVIGADGNITPCNCAPRVNVGRIATESLLNSWNDEPLRSWRLAVLNGTCRECLICPRY
jgi:MoaA/NifB/PqqE/SkfB family radical SAM enzyme/pimeloyl-ACP methyl ester carboxylesterase